MVARKRTLVIAQGGGFYGCAIWTTRSHIDAVIDVVRSLNPRPGLESKFDDGRMFVFDVPEDFGPQEQMVIVRTAQGINAPDPVMVFESGRAHCDLSILARIRDLCEVQGG